MSNYQRTAYLRDLTAKPQPGIARCGRIAADGVPGAAAGTGFAPLGGRPVATPAVECSVTAVLPMAAHVNVPFVGTPGFRTCDPPV